MMRYLLMTTVPLLSLRLTTLPVSRKLDRRRDEALPDRACWGGGVKLRGPPPLSPPPPPPASRPRGAGLRLDALPLDMERNKRLPGYLRPR